MHSPLISIIIPTFARPRQLRACLRAIADLQTDGFTFEVLVVDDGSPDSPAPLVAEFAARIPITLVEQERGGPGSARNAGARVARGRYLAFLDDDCRPASDWLTVLVRELERNPARLLGGHVENALPDNPYAEASEWIRQFVYEQKRGEVLEPFFTTNNLALSAELFAELGGFTTAIPSATAEDKEFCDRWRARGLELLAIPEAVVHHAHDLRFRSFVRQHFNYGRGILAFRLLRRSRAARVAAVPNRNGTGSPLIPESFGFYVSLVMSPARARRSRRPVRLLGLVAISQMATAAGALTESIRFRRLVRGRVHPTEV